MLFQGDNYLNFKTQSDTFTTASNGTTINIGSPFKSYAIQVSPTGTVTSWTVVLEGNLDNSANFTTILSHTSLLGANIVLFSGSIISPAMSIRARCSAIVLGVGTNIIATILGVE